MGHNVKVIYFVKKKYYGFAKQFFFIINHLTLKVKWLLPKKQKMINFSRCN